MKRIVFIIFAISAISVLQTLNAQSVKFGFNIASMGISSNSYERSGFLIRPEIGYVIPLESSFNNLELRLEPSLSWRGMNYQLNRTFENVGGLPDYIVETRYRVKLTYMEYPLIASMDLGKIDFEFGPSLSFQMGGKRRGQTKITRDYAISVDQQVEFTEDGNYGDKNIFPKGIDAGRPINFFDLGWNIGASYTVNTDIALSIRYYYGIVDVMRRNYPVQNSSNAFNNNKLLKFALHYSL